MGNGGSLAAGAEGLWLRNGEQGAERREVQLEKQQGLPGLLCGMGLG